MKIVAYFLKRPTLFWSLMIGLLLAGLLSFIQMPKLEDPAVCVKQAMVVIPYPGATAHDVELQAAMLMEDELRTIPGVKKIKTDCQNGSAQITVEFVPEVLNTQIEQRFDLLRRKVSDAATKLPQGCYTPVVVDDMMDVYGMFYAFTGDGYEPDEMYKYARLIRRELLKVKGVKRINIYGNRDEEINIVISKDKIARNGLIPTQIASSLQSAVKSVDAGKYSDDGEKLQLRITNQVKDEQDIKNLLIQTIDGKQLRLGDIAEVERQYVIPQRNGFFIDGKPALGILISTEDNVNVPVVGEKVDKRLSEIMPDIPAGLTTQKVFFQPDKVNEAIDSFMINLIESVLIVIIVLIFTMGFRSGLIIGIGLILTIAGSFPILLMCGTTLQRISLGAFIVAMGMLVDNAIVVMDGILVDKLKGLPPKKYLFNIGKKTALPLLGATIIAASSLLCIFLSKNSAGEYARDVFLVMAVSLLISWGLALIQVPIFAKTLFSPRLKQSQGNKHKESSLHRLVRRSIIFLIAHKTATVGVAIGCLMISGYGMTKVKNLFFPDFSYKQFVIEYFLPAQTDPEQVKENLIAISNRLRENPKIESVAASMGGAPGRYSLVRPMTSGGDCYGELIVDCPDYETVLEQIPLIQKQLREEFPDAYIRLRKYNFSTSTSHTVEVAFSGPDPAVLRRLCNQAEEIFRECPYVDPYSVQNNWKPMSKALLTDYSQQDALCSGIGRPDIANALQAATDGMVVGAINDDDTPIKINLKVRNADRSQIKDLSNIPVWSSMNIKMDDKDIQSFISGGKSSSDIEDNLFKSTPLSNIGKEIRPVWEEETVLRVNGQRNMEVECDPDFSIYEATPAKIINYVSKEMEAIHLPEGYNMEWVGEMSTSSESVNSLLAYLPITIFLILAILLMLFNSWKKVILILLCFPFVICGIAPALLIAHQPFTFMAILGMFGLIGMMIKNAIVLIDEINRLIIEEHQLPYAAVINATVSRVRPVMMASLTTIVGMIPLVVDPMYSSMAIIIIGGLTVGTIITLILLPLLYTVFFRIKTPINMNK